MDGVRTLTGVPGGTLSVKNEQPVEPRLFVACPVRERSSWAMARLRADVSGGTLRRPFVQRWYLPRTGAF